MNSIKNEPVVGDVFQYGDQNILPDNFFEVLAVHKNEYWIMWLDDQTTEITTGTYLWCKFELEDT